MANWRPSTVPESTPLTYRYSFLASWSYTPATCVHLPTCAGSAEYTVSVPLVPSSALTIANVHRPPFSGRYQRFRPENLAPSWLTIARAPALLSSLTHAATEKLVSVRIVFGAVMCAPVSGLRCSALPTAPGT